MEHTLLPNSTPFPDHLVDYIMPLVTGDEWKIIHYAVRHTFGYDCSGEHITIAEFSHGHQREDGTWLDHGTGLSEATVKTCLDFLCDVVHLFLREDRPRRPLGYRLNLNLATVNVAALEQRAAMGTVPSPSTGSAVARGQEGRASALPLGAVSHVEKPLTEVTLDGSAGSVVQHVRAALGSAERQTFDYLLRQAVDKLGIPDGEDCAWQVYRLWRMYGFRRLNNAFQQPGPLTLDLVAQSCLVAEVASALEQERFGPITPAFRERLVELTGEFRQLDDWMEAIKIAVDINRRRLATLETILRNRVDKPMEVDKANGRTTGAKGARRPRRRISEWSEEELRAAREADAQKEWPEPPH